MTRGGVGQNAAFAVGRVGEIKQATELAKKPVRIVKAASQNNPAHAAIRRVEHATIVELDKVAQQAFDAMYDINGNCICESAVMGVPSSV